MMDYRTMTRAALEAAALEAMAGDMELIHTTREEMEAETRAASDDDLIAYLEEVEA